MRNLLFRRVNSLLLLVICLLLLCAFLAVRGHADDTKVSLDLQNRLHTVLLDQARQQAQALQLQIQYNTIQATLQHDNAEIESLIKEALDAAKLDVTKWTLDTEKMSFVPKPEAPKK